MAAPPGDRLRRSWVDNAAAWTEAVRGDAIESRRLGTRDAIVAAVRAGRPRRVLDLGCGEGWLVHALAADGVEAVGVDGSAPLVQAAQAAGPGEFHCADYAALDAVLPAARRFDAIACNFSLLDEDGPTRALLVALRARLAPGGRLLVQTLHPWAGGGDAPYRDGWRTETFDAFGGRFPSPMPWYFRTLASWLALLHGAGLVLRGLQEPAHPDTGAPLSLLLVAGAAD